SAGGEVFHPLPIPAVPQNANRAALMTAVNLKNLCIACSLPYRVFGQSRSFCLLLTVFFPARGEGCQRRAHGHLEGFFGNAGYEGLDQPTQSCGNVASEGN